MGRSAETQPQMLIFSAEAFEITLRPQGRHSYQVKTGQCFLDVQISGARTSYVCSALADAANVSPSESLIFFVADTLGKIDATRLGWSLQFSADPDWFKQHLVPPQTSTAAPMSALIHTHDTTMAGLAGTFRDLMLHSKGRISAADLEAFAKMLVMRLSVHLLMTATPPTAQKREAARIRQVTTFIEENLDANLTGPKLAEVAGVSPFQFARLFRHETGSSLHQYVINRRVAKAMDLLERGEKTLSQVAFASGFGSQSHMTHVFSRLVGITPGKYRDKKD